MYAPMFEALQPIPMLKEHLADLHSPARNGVRDAVQRGIDDRSVDGLVDGLVDADGMARLLTGALRGAAYQPMLDPEGVNIFDALDDIDRMIE